MREVRAEPRLLSPRPSRWPIGCNFGIGITYRLHISYNHIYPLWTPTTAIGSQAPGTKSGTPTGSHRKSLILRNFSPEFPPSRRQRHISSRGDSCRIIRAPAIPRARAQTTAWSSGCRGFMEVKLNVCAWSCFSPSPFQFHFSRDVGGSRRAFVRGITCFGGRGEI